MMPSGRIAYAHSRILARKSRLLGPRDAAALLAASDEAALNHALTALGVDPATAFAKLIDIYALAIRTYRAPLFRALLALHEIENVKLMWRVAERNRDRAFVRRLWRPLGALVRVPMIDDAASPRDLAERLAKTPYGTIAMSIVRSGAAPDAALDRWASQQLAAEAAKVKEPLARKLIDLLIAERDARGGVALRRQRLRLCRRAFVGNPFLLAPAVAVVLLAEEEVRGVTALVERGGDPALDEVALATMAASQMSEA